MNGNLALSQRGRWGASALAIFGTAAYGASFVFHLPSIAPHGIAIGIAAGLAWIVLGTIVLIAAPKHASAWADVCLRTMAVGMPWLLLAAAMNLVLHLGLYPMIAVNLVFLIAADVTMTRQFIRNARRRGFSAAHAIALWALGLHLSFAAIVFALAYWKVLQ
jgi:hypothetical protein